MRRRMLIEIIYKPTEEIPADDFIVNRVKPFLNGLGIAPLRESAKILVDEEIPETQ